MSMTRNISAREAYTTAVMACVGLTAGTQQSVSYADCAAMLKRVTLERGDMDAVALLYRFGLQELRHLATDRYADFIHYSNVVLQLGLSPRDAWREDAIPHASRDRWLLAHHESSCIWEVRVKLSGADLAGLESGEVEDVSGVLQWENQYAIDGATVEDEL